MCALSNRWVSAALLALYLVEVVLSGVNVMSLSTPVQLGLHTSYLSAYLRQRPADRPAVSRSEGRNRSQAREEEEEGEGGGEKKDVRNSV